MEALERQSRELAQSGEARRQWIGAGGEVSGRVQEAGEAWASAVEACQTNRAVGGEGKIKQVEEEDGLQRAVLWARIIRNATADHAAGQEACYEAVPFAVQTLWKTTSFTLESAKDIQLLTRTLVQLLSNMVTQNDSLQGRLWRDVLSITDAEKEDTARGGADLLVRLLQSSDAGTSTATQVLLLNCTLKSGDRSQSICTSVTGCKVVQSMLAIMHSHLDEDEEEEDREARQQALFDGDSAIDVTQGQGANPKQQSRYESMGLMYSFFTNLFDRQLFGTLFSNLAPATVDDGGGAESLVSHGQLSLLKLLDSYLHFGASSYAGNNSECSAVADLDGLTLSFDKLSTWAEDVMASAVKEGTESKVDLRLVNVHVALILLLQCLITLGLKTEGDGNGEKGIRGASGQMLSAMRSDAFVRNVVKLLHTLSAFSPPVSPFQPSSSTHLHAPAGHALSSTGAAASRAPAHRGPSLDNLKRDLVNLLGVLSYVRPLQHQSEVQVVQDAVRESGGLFDVMNMTQLDEHNPYIRERAIFALRNLLRGNKASQELIAQLKPVAGQGV